MSTIPGSNENGSKTERDAKAKHNDYYDRIGDTLISTDDHEEAEDHIDERWLISYSDMMTLLFGLFVMLYAISMETQGKPEQYFKDISKMEKTNDAKPAPPRFADLQKQNQILNEGLLSKKKELEYLNSQLATKDEQLKGLLAQSEAYKSNISQLQGQLQQFQAQSGKKAPSGSAAQAVAEQTSLQNRIKVQEQEIEKLNTKIEDLKTHSADSFMVIYIQWETEKHDIDLKITDPKGQLYNFEKREYKDNKSKFVIDSRGGPGIELWQTPKIAAGSYSIEVNLYNNYGNNVPSVVRGTIVTRKGEFKFPDLKMDFASSRKKVFQIVVTEVGTIQFK